MKHTNRARALSAFVAIAGLAAATLAVSAQTPRPVGPPPGPPPGTMRLPANDAEFVRALDTSNTSELDVAKYVVNRTKDPAVHQFAQHMIDDHSTAAVKLEAATRGTNLRPVPRDDGSPPPRANRILSLLQSDDGPKMDSDFMRAQVPAHQRALALLQWEAQNGANIGLKTLATQMMPTVQQHLQLAQQYLAAHNLTPFTPPEVGPVPGNVNPNNRLPGAGPGVPNNPASMPNGGSTSGQGNGSGSGTPPPPSSPVPTTSPSPHG